VCIQNCDAGMVIAANAGIKVMNEMPASKQ
jgi:hypothetical protein